MERRRPQRRATYVALRERLDEAGLPWDAEAERQAIGCVLLAPRVHAKRLARRAFKDHFYDERHAWLWGSIGFGLAQEAIDFHGNFGFWLVRDRWQAKYRQRFGASVVQDIVRCLEGCFWWHGNYWVDRVLKAAKVRARIVAAAKELGAALDAAEVYR